MARVTKKILVNYLIYSLKYINAMHAQLILILSNSLIQAVNTNDFPSFCTSVLENASAKLYHFSQGELLLQSFSHYMAHIELFEYLVQEETKIDLMILESCFLMPVIRYGKSTLYNLDGEIISETMGNSCTIGHFTAGNYQWKLAAGQHKLLLLTFRPHWFLQKTEIFPELAPLMENYLTIKQPYHVFPHCVFADEIFKHFEQCLHEIDKLHCSQGTDTYNFIDNCINAYRRHLDKCNFDLNTIYKTKALAIADYIELNFADEILDHASLLAQKFNLSERSMLRYFKQARNQTIHDYIIKIRMQHAIGLLETTTLAVKEVAARVGYHNPHYFSTAFKKFYGIRPTEVPGAVKKSARSIAF